MSAIPLLTKKTAGRMVEIDKKLEIVDGVAEVMLSDILDDIIRGETGLIMEGWEFDDRAKAEAALAELGVKWAQEDASEASSDAEEGRKA